MTITTAVKNKLCGAATTLLVAGTLFSNTATAQEEWDFTWASGSTSGTFNIVVTAIAEKLRADYPGISVDIIPGGSVSNTIRLGRNDVPVATITSVTAKQGYNGVGEERFKEEGPYSDIRGVAALYNQHLQLIVPEDFPADTLGEVIEKKMPISIVPGGPRGHIGVAAMSDLLGHVYGITLEDMEEWGADVFYAEFGDASRMIRDGQLDMFTPLTAAPNGAVLDLANSQPIKLLGLREETQKEMEEIGYVIADLPADTYPGQTEPVPTIAAPAAIYASKNTDAELVEAITKTIVKYEDELKRSHARMQEDFNAQTAYQGLGVPLHSGAEKAYRDLEIID